MSNSNQSRDLSPLPPDTTAVAPGRSVRPPNKVCRVLKKIKSGVTNKISRSNLKNSRNHDLVRSNIDREDPSSIPNAEVQDTPLSVEQCADPKWALRDAEQAVKGMNLLSGLVGSGAPAAQNAPADLEAAYNFQDTYLKPLRIFDDVIGKLADVHPYAKIALGVLSCASKIILAQTDRDQRIFRLLEKLGQVYNFMMEDSTLGGIPSMQSIIGRLVQQTLECAQFIKDYSATKNFCEEFTNYCALLIRSLLILYCCYRA
ncbi:hypothetical protein BDR05DRAFT_1006495 [Suillus weaverae]|nr:hypothetical protein BDR05DRAFT_1006495 [Suillus weaverae]